MVDLLVIVLAFLFFYDTTLYDLMCTSCMSECQVNAVQACGGQMTADGRRFRTGGGILWSIIKTREPNAYKEIMKRAKEFEVSYKTFSK